MAQINLIIGAIFGMVAIVGGPIGAPTVKLKLDEQLRAKAKLVPGPALPNGDPGPEIMEISSIDRQENELRWENYQHGVQYVMYHALALTALGVVGTRGYGQIIGGSGFVLGTLLYGGGLALGAILDMPTLQVGMSVGGVLLLVGWCGLALATISARPKSVNPALDS
ncbi:DUF423 domain-containing protein [Bremerella sp. T1]|uniref:DUF423 domain-containing protein n=1 Tax=Bremerella sp. TYQ1 TaxID=3119568 RepID=UPI001CCEF20B|nr:DUF423 domain-containing protein [Bremerella volcania]UBM35803.1 DUF423 domain-containing protein [Bremerella volcania]